MPGRDVAEGFDTSADITLFYLRSTCPAFDRLRIRIECVRNAVVGKESNSFDIIFQKRFVGLDDRLQILYGLIELRALLG